LVQTAQLPPVYSQQLIAQELQCSQPDSVHIFFSAHGVPLQLQEAGDPYQQEIEDCTSLSSTLNRPNLHPGLPEPGRARMAPAYTEDAIKELGAKALKIYSLFPSALSLNTSKH